MEALIRDIDHYLRHEPLEAQPKSWSYWLGKFVTRNRRAVAAAVLLVALFAGMAIFFMLRLAKERNTALAEAARTRRIQRVHVEPFRWGQQSGGSS